MPPHQSPYGGDPLPAPGQGSPSGPPYAAPTPPAPEPYAPYQTPGQVPPPGNVPGQLPYAPQPAAATPPAPLGSQSPTQGPLPPFIPPPSGQAGPGIIPPPPPRPKSPYDFFLNPQVPHHEPGSKVPFKNASIGIQIAMIAGGGLLLVILIGIATLFLPKGDPKLALVAIAQAQTESLRICSLGVQQAKVAANRDFAMTCTLAMTTEQRQLLAQLDKAGISVKGNTLSAGRNQKADQLLASAKSSSNFDEVFREVSQQQLVSQANLIKQAGLSPSTNAAEQALLVKHAESTKLLLQQLKQN